MNINLSETAVDLILNIINIVILFVVVRALVYKPVHKFLSERTARVNEETAKAQKMLDEANETLSRKDEIIKESELKGEELANKAYREAKQNADTIIADAKLEAKKIKEKAEADISAQRENMLASAKNEIAELAVGIAERILKREVNEKDNEKIVEDFFGEA